VVAQLCPGRQRGVAQRRERVAYVGVFPVQSGQAVDLVFFLGVGESTGDEGADTCGDGTDDLFGCCGHGNLQRSEAWTPLNVPEPGLRLRCKREIGGSVRQDARENRERILAAAEEVFGAEGSAGSTEEVARRAGVGVATVFRHFPTKEALVEAALVRHFDDLTARARSLGEATEPGEAWRIVVRTMIRHGATKLTLAAMLGAPRTFPASAAAASERLKSEVGALLRRAQNNGDVRSSATIEEIYVLIRGLSQASATMPTPPDVLDRAIDVVLTGLTEPTRRLTAQND
jgi:AcrR family transcriptional regulator